jgi:hypothetical protein
MKIVTEILLIVVIFAAVIYGNHLQRAADLAQPSDTIIVHKGIYRERINPPRGGKSDSKRIVYKAALGEEAVIKGSKVIKNWVKDQGDVWKVMIPNSITALVVS